MKKVFSLIMFAFLSVGVMAQTTWKVDPAHSQVSFGIQHLTISEIEGLFDSFDATIVADQADFSDAKFDVTIDVNSINTGVQMRDDHLRNPDFFEVEKYPEMTFKSTAIESAGDDRYKVTGDLTFHGVTKPVSLEVWYRGTIENNDDVVSGFQITGEIKRSDFNLGPDFPEAVLSDKVRIKVDGEFKKQA